MKNWHWIRLGIVMLTLIIAAGWVTNVSAAPAAPIDLVLTQPDGTTFSGRQWGDEWQNGVETDAGYAILQDSDGWWVYAAPAADGTLSPALQMGAQRLVVGKDDPQGLSLHLRPAERNAPEPTIDGLYSQNKGTQPVLVLLASFSDRNGTYTPASFANLIFGGSGSVKDYYADASFNQLTLSPAAESNGTANDGVIGWLNLGYAHPNTGSYTGPANAKIVSDALTMANKDINFASYDTNGDGYISLNELHIVVVVAGYEASYDPSTTPNIWAHRWVLSVIDNGITPPTLDGKVICDRYHNGGYAQFGEIHGYHDIYDHQATIGIMAHELGHDLTWPDLYDIDDSSEGVGEWSIMGSGSWNSSSGYAGSSPALPDAWLKWYQGWITPISVSGTLADVPIPQAETDPTTFLLRPNPNGVDWNFNVQSGVGEYFLVENRQKTGYDAGLPGCGLLIWHIDESVVDTNSANADENDPLVKLIEADGQNNLYYANNRGDTGDPFPGSSNNQMFSYSSTPNSHLYSGADSLAMVNGISSCAATMRATLTYDSSLPPTFLLKIKNSGYGTIVSSPAGINCGSNCAITFESNTSIVLTAVEAPGSTFTGWSGDDCTGTGTCTLTMNTHKSVNANFRMKPVFLPLVLKPGLKNGNFEAGQDGNWTEYSSNGYDLILDASSFAITPHEGTWAAWLGGDNNETSTLTQTGVTLSGVRYLHYWYWIDSTDSCGFDFATVSVNGNSLASYNLCTSTNTGGWVEGVLDLNGYAGQTISLEFKANTDGSNISNFFLDDVAITSSASAGAPLASPAPTGSESLSKAELQK